MRGLVSTSRVFSVVSTGPRMVTRTEEWVELEEFPGYAISNHGRVQNINSELIKTPTLNQQGIPNVNLILDHQQYRRSVTLLVAKTFLPPPEMESFDTPINLDGDRMNNHVDNLMWRPRWFALKYHAQYKKPVAYGFTGAIELIDTGEIFDNVRTLCMTYGLLEKEVILAAQNKIPVFPGFRHVQIVV